MKALYQFVLGLLAISNFTTADFRDEALAIHNKFRKKHRVLPYVRNTTLDKVAQEKAKLVAKDPSNFKWHGRNGNYGENMYGLSTVKLTDSDMIKKAIKMWYDGIKDYDFSKPEKVKGHAKEFAQVVWKDSRSIGIVIARSSKDTWVCVDYDPPGSLRESYPQNVLKPEK